MQLPQELLTLIQNGENNTVEFKKSTTEITKDVYDSVCSFSNRDGGHIFLGVKDNIVAQLSRQKSKIFIMN
ncbi:putative DNA binding domain-containing protein [Enterocloster clostridioformis]|uniref:AlbA family DNA-binding domain-containing protein n=1 Tax=Enterocloster clostridioformis TaxID=1531 RepID=UPI00232F96B7|nr:RNA-binding domain-containing protein [Enterocloster clostridioformis]MDB2135966.1 putative DNA binding domain-containing protein [Enterocloster clostridioformis]